MITMSINKTVWLVEYVGAVPMPVYVARDYKKTHGNHTLDAWAARPFNTKAEAEAWMAKPTYITEQFQTTWLVPFGPPWAAVEHSFFGEEPQL